MNGEDGSAGSQGLQGPEGRKVTPLYESRDTLIMTMTPLCKSRDLLIMTPFWCSGSLLPHKVVVTSVLERDEG